MRAGFPTEVSCWHCIFRSRKHPLEKRIGGILVDGLVELGRMEHLWLVHSVKISADSDILQCQIYDRLCGIDKERMSVVKKLKWWNVFDHSILALVSFCCGKRNNEGLQCQWHMSLMDLRQRVICKHLIEVIKKVTCSEYMKKILNEHDQNQAVEWQDRRMLPVLQEIQHISTTKLKLYMALKWTLRQVLIDEEVENSNDSEERLIIGKCRLEWKEKEMFIEPTDWKDFSCCLETRGRFMNTLWIKPSPVRMVWYINGVLMNLNA